MATLGPGGGLIPDQGPSWWNPAWGGGNAYGTRPTVPSPTQTAGQALAGNIGNLGNIYGLGAGLNRFQAQQAASQYAQNLPGYQDLITKSSGNIGQMLSGQLPSDVVQTITQNAAARGITMGDPGSPNTNAALLRSLGLTSLGLQQTGEQELSAAIQRTPTGGLFNTSSMLVSPEQQQAAQAAAQLYASGPDPSTAARSSLINAQAGLRGGMGIGGTPGFGQLSPTTPSGGYQLAPTTGWGGGTPTSTNPFTQQQWLASIGGGATGTPAPNFMGNYTGIPDYLNMGAGYPGGPVQFPGAGQNYPAGAPTIQNAAGLPAGSGAGAFSPIENQNLPGWPYAGWGNYGQGSYAPITSTATNAPPPVENQSLPGWPYSGWGNYGQGSYSPDQTDWSGDWATGVF